MRALTIRTLAFVTVAIAIATLYEVPEAESSAIFVPGVDVSLLELKAFSVSANGCLCLPTGGDACTYSYNFGNCRATGGTCDDENFYCGVPNCSGADDDVCIPWDPEDHCITSSAFCCNVYFSKCKTEAGPACTCKPETSSQPIWNRNDC